MQRRPPGTTTTLTLFPYRAGCHARVAGATLGVPGLSGQVANIITASTGVSGSFAWRPQIRARRTEARLTNGEVSVSGKAAGFDYTLSLANDSFRNGNAGQEIRSEEHTSELQSLLRISYADFCLQKKKSPK